MSADISTIVTHVTMEYAQKSNSVSIMKHKKLKDDLLTKPQSTKCK